MSEKYFPIFNALAEIQLISKDVYVPSTTVKLETLT